MVVTPDSRIILLKSPLKLDHSNQITFANSTAQFNYFYGLTKLEHGSFSYIRKDGVVRIPTHITENDGLPTYEDLLGYNYCMYQNTHYKSKWFYAFITDVTYANDGMATITLETDVFQTWQFDIIYMNSFVEREHVSDDTIGNHTIPEGLETGEYVINDAGWVANFLSPENCYVCMGVSYVPDGSSFVNDNRYYGGIYSGLINIVFKTMGDASKFIRAYDQIGRGDAIITCYMIPSALCVLTAQSWLSGDLGDETGIIFAPLPSTSGVQTISSSITIARNTTLNGYTPKNNKMFTYPYNCLSISNNAGTQAEFRYEDFTNASPEFKMIGIETAGCPILLLPKNYKKYTDDVYAPDHLYNYGLSAGKFPMCSWSTDLYTNWMTQNGINILGTTIDAPTKMAIGGSLEALTGAGAMDVEGIGSGLGKMFGAVQEQYRHSMQSPRINGQTTIGDLAYSNKELTMTYYKMSVRYEYAKIIDDFFTMYGYKVNSLKTPNIHKRTYWDYIKTIEINLEGNIPEKDLDEIRRMFNAGCTFWHDTTKFLDYSQTNSIIS